MKQFFSVLLITVALFVLCSTSAVAWDREYMKGFALGKAIDLCELVVVGEISSVESVWREEVACKITTDITVDVDKVILGTPNAAPAKVEFMVEGGRVRNPNTGKMQGMIATNMPYTRFKVGQRAVFFLFVGKEDKFYANYPHGKHQLLHNMYGMRLIKDNKIDLYYLPTLGNEFKVVEYPLDLLTELGAAFVENKEGAGELEALIKSRVDRSGFRKVRLPGDTVTDIKNRAKQIVDAAKKAKRSRTDNE